jgi:hypothetical protein
MPKVETKRPPCVAVAPLRKCGTDDVGREVVVVTEEDEE